MPTYLCISIHFLQPYWHGRGDGGQPHWPPSPLRVFQALVAAAAGHWNEPIQLPRHVLAALRWLETRTSPLIVAPDAQPLNRPYRLYVPNNTADTVAASWLKGRTTSITGRRTEKDVRPMHLFGQAVHYLYSLAGGTCPHLDILAAAARSITHLGWGIDMVVGNASVVSDREAASLQGHRWQPAAMGGAVLRVPREGTLDNLMRKHKAFLNRLSNNVFRPVPPLTKFDRCSYRRDDEVFQRPYCVFELRTADGLRFRYSHRKLIHIAGMVRHLAIKAMKTSPPDGVGDDWVETYVAGHSAANQREHSQLSYLPLPSIGHLHTDPGVRRVMIAAPVGHDAWLKHLAKYLRGRTLEPLRGDEFAQAEPPLLMATEYDNVSRFYTRAANVWHSVTPVILPGHDDRKPDKTRKLIHKALAQSGIEQPCEFHWSPFSRFPKALSAHKYDRQGKPTGYIRPDYLSSQTAVHLTLKFDHNLRICGPLAIGAGRHCGLGLFAAVE